MFNIQREKTLMREKKEEFTKRVENISSVSITLDKKFL